MGLMKINRYINKRKLITMIKKLVIFIFSMLSLFLQAVVQMQTDED